MNLLAGPLNSCGTVMKLLTSWLSLTYPGMFKADKNTAATLVFSNSNV